MIMKKRVWVAAHCRLTHRLWTPRWLLRGQRKGRVKYVSWWFSKYFEKKLDGILCCTHQSCGCLLVLYNPCSKLAIANYLAWFEHMSKYQQDSILLQWMIYRKVLPGSNNCYWYHVPFDGLCFDDDEDSIQTIRSHLLCTAGIQTVMGIGKHRTKTIHNASTSTAIMPFSASHGKPSHAEMKIDNPRAIPLVQHHMEYLL